MKKYVDNVLVDLPPSELAERQQDALNWQNGAFDRSMEDLRLKRDMLLNQTDYIVIKAKETGGTIPSAWKTYRQELRDLTNGLTTVDEVNAVEFPERPTS